MVILHEGRGLNFFFDEWDFVLRQRSGVHSLFEPHVGHLSLVPLVIYRILFHTVGLAPYWPYRLVALLLHLTCVGLLFVLARRRVGPWLALLAATVLLFLGSAWEDLLWPFQIGYLSSLAAGLGAFLALDRHDRTGDVTAGVLLGVSLASSGVGLPILAGAAVEVLWTRDRWARIWLVLAPLALYLAWWLDFQPSGQALRSNIPDTPRYVGDIGASAVGGITGLGLDWGRPLLAGAAVLLVARLISPRPIPPRLAAMLATALAFWIATGLSRAQLGLPGSSRYIYVGAIFILLLAAEMSVGARPLAAAAWAILLVFVAASVTSNVGSLRDGGRTLRGTDRTVSAELGALELSGAAVLAAYQPDASRAPQVTAGPYLAAVHALGSPAYRPAQIERLTPGYQQAADAVLVGTGEVRLLPGQAGAGVGAAPPTVDGQPQGSLTRSGACVVYRPAPVPGAAVDVTVPAGGISIRAGSLPVTVLARRFSPVFGQSAVGSVPPHQTAQLSVRQDRAGLPWHVRLSGSDQVSACAVS